MKNLRIKKRSFAASITLFVNGTPVAAHEGDSVFAALHAAGYLVLRRSPQAGEPRGAFCGMGLCQECRVTIDGTPGRCACMALARNRMEIKIDEP
jgi:hypothetical protein